MGIEISRERLDIEADTGPARESRLPVLASDLEQTMGPLQRHPEAARARELLARPVRAYAAQRTDTSLADSDGLFAAE